MLRVLLVYYEPSQSGQTTHVLSLVNGLDQHHYDLMVVLPDHLEQTSDIFRQAGVRVYPLSMRKVIWKSASLLQFIRLIRKGSFDIVHVHSQEAGLITRVLTTIAGAKHTIYTPQTIDIRRTECQWLYVLFERILSIVTDKIISVNEVDRKRLVKWGIPSEKVVSIPNSIDLSLFEKPGELISIRNQLGLNPNSPVVMQVGRLSPQKDPIAFVDGASFVIKEYPEAQFVMVGNGPMEDQVREYIQALGLGTSVKLAGWRDSAYKIIPLADVLTLTSQWEGTPFSLLEAMAWSKPVVATAVNGCTEVVVDGNTGFLVQPGDPSAWASRIVELLDKPELSREMGQRGRTRVESKFCNKVMVERIEILYNQVVDIRREGDSQIL